MLGLELRKFPRRIIAPNHYTSGLCCTNTPDFGGMLISDTVPIRYGIDTYPICQVAYRRLFQDVDFTIRLRYSIDTITIRSRYCADTSRGNFDGNQKEKTKKEERRKNEEEKNLTCACNYCQSAIADSSCVKKRQLTNEEDDVKCPNYNTHCFSCIGGLC
ncbi:hypothetical protein Pyn_16162 [Prunus yedoensis var. nudiflora]|uniref:Uncharacterized protein n=1 Tax=Prunus yedoensis var. nudiflora TaxID=2094558 RepID=A0A314YCL6_PRUYE|nr:hypothetical protein Pyn_16162 [Prunus yedoensis var. nudiflora]